MISINYAKTEESAMHQISLGSIFLHAHELFVFLHLQMNINCDLNANSGIIMKRNIFKFVYLPNGVITNGVIKH